LVKVERVQVEEVPGTAWLIGLAAWFIPGLGHVLLKRWFRALLMGGAINSVLTEMSPASGARKAQEDEAEHKIQEEKKKQKKKPKRD